MKQTAAQWLIDQLISENEVVLKGENYKLFEQAIAMEKEQIIDAYKHNSMIRTQSKAEQYYNETYGKYQ